MNKYVIGIDFGTDSCRTLLVNVYTGEELSSVTEYYPRWKRGLYFDPAINQYRQHPLDYIESMELAVKRTLAACPLVPATDIIGISVDTTGSTPVLTNAEGIPLALLPEYSENPNAMFILWKDHTATQEAAEINKLVKEWPVDYTIDSGGVYSSEWVWAKMLHVLRVDPALSVKAYSWTEHCDWIPALLTGNTSPEKMYRSRCAAGHKALWSSKWNGLPAAQFLSVLDPLLNIFDGHLYHSTFTSDICAGNLTPEWAERFGLTTLTVVGVGAIDCHVGAVGAQITDRTFVRVMGTSTCDVMVSPYEEIGDRHIAGICGQVDGSVIPGMIGLEAGQSAFGDIYAWFKKLLLWPSVELLPSFLDECVKDEIIQKMEDHILYRLTQEAEKIPLSESNPVSVDWMNGRRTPFANQKVNGLISGLTLGTSAPMLFRSLVEATAFGSKSIVDCFLEQGIAIEKIIAIGGISKKSSFVMQVLADVLNMPIQIARSEQTCALGAAMFASVVAGVYPGIEQAQAAMGKGFEVEIVPDRERHLIYRSLYERYTALGTFLDQSFRS